MCCLVKTDVKPDIITFNTVMNGYYLDNEVKNAKHDSMLWPKWK